MNPIMAALKVMNIPCDSLYKAMSYDDFCGTVLAANDILKHLGAFSSKHISVREKKCEQISNELRNKGNIAFGAHNYQLALICYNKALAYAPEDSRAMKLIYSNRSALLLKNFQYIACLNDIEKLFAMGCPDDIKNKLTNRKTEVLQMIWIEQGALMALNDSSFINEFFKLKGKANRDIPCAITDVGVIEEGQQKRVVAIKDIKVGAVLANEQAFTIMHNKDLQYCECYYCCKLSMNLMPCPGCCHVLYCSEHCKNLSMAEGHNIECQIMDIIDGIDTPKVHFGLKTALKIKTMCHSWKELIDTSNRLGIDRIQTSTVKEIYDRKEKFSLLNVESESLFIYGQVHSYSFPFAIIAHFLRDVPSFLPTDPEDRHNALYALLKIAMYLSLHEMPVVLTPCVNDITKHQTTFHNQFKFGSFAFIGKLKHSCHPNCVEVCLNNRLALVAIKPIQSGTELTVSKLGVHDIHKDMVPSKMPFYRYTFSFYKQICYCVCTHDKLTVAQRGMVNKLNGRLSEANLISDKTYSTVFDALATLSDAEHTKEYWYFFDIFMKCIKRAQDVATRNIVINVDYFLNKTP